MAAPKEIPENALRLERVQPRLGEFDLGGVLYHARYFHVYEDAREQMLRAFGSPYPELVAEGFHLAVVEAHQQFRSPVRYGEPFDVFVWIEELRRSTVTVRYAFVGELGAIVHSAWTKHILVLDKREQGFAATRIPEALRVGFQRYCHD